MSQSIYSKKTVMRIGAYRIGCQIASAKFSRQSVTINMCVYMLSKLGKL